MRRAAGRTGLMKMRHRLDWRLLAVAARWIMLAAFAVVVSPAAVVFSEATPSPVSLPTGHSNGAGSSPLVKLIDEALRQSPLIVAARRHWEAETRMPIQQATLPDPQITFQNLAVGNPIPGNNLQTNNFAYFGYGFSQDIPFPGKLRLRASVAEKDAESAREALEAQQRAVVEQVSETYFNLFYLMNSLNLLQQTYDEFQRVVHITGAQYQVGMAQQQDVLKAQLEMTSILNEQQTTRQESEQGQADLKVALGREQDSADIQVSNVQPTVLNLDDHQLRQLALSASPVLKQAKALEQKSEQSLKLACQDYFPDFSISYMYQKTGARFPDYYMATVGLTIPLYFWRKQTPEVEQAVLEKDSSRAQTYAAKLSVTAEVQNQWVAIQSMERVLRIYNDGLIPQAQATLKSAVATYQVGKVDFQTLLSAEVDVLRLKQQYYRAVADHEIAVAKIQQVTGNVR
jgi:outer membrane protein, heavy metal efflux system